MSGSTEHRRAPRRQIKEIQKVGTWGNIEYRHILSCGHIEIRPRASRAPKLACAWCLRAEDKQMEMLALTQSPPPIVDDIDFSNEEQEVQMIRAAIAKRLNVSSEAVDVVVRDTGGRLEIINVRVFLSASEARRIAGQST